MDGTYSFSLQMSVVLKEGLKIGQVLSPERIHALICSSLTTDLIGKVMELIAIRPRSEKEIREYLANKVKKLGCKSDAYVKKIEQQITGDSATLINQIITKLKKNHYIDDQEFAKWWVSQRIVSKPRGSIALSAELQRKGVGKSAITNVLKNGLLLNNETKKAMMQKILDKAWRAVKHRGYDKRKLKTVLLRRLYAKGFTWDEMKPEIDEFLSRQYNK